MPSFTPLFLTMAATVVGDADEFLPFLGREPAVVGVAHSLVAFCSVRLIHGNQEVAETRHPRTHQRNR